MRVPAAGRRWPEYEYGVDEVENAGDVTVGDAIADSGVVSRLIEAENRRSRRRVAEEHDQKWFCGAPADATQYVRSKIGSARRSVLIVDPYFSTVGLMAFGHAARRPDVAVRILTSADSLKESERCERRTTPPWWPWRWTALLQWRVVRCRSGKKPANAEPRSDQGSILQRVLDETFDRMAAKPKIRVLPGKSSPIHDRFLVVDGEVWLSGNSLSTLGERAGMIVRLPDPEQVISRLETFWKDSRVLSDWLSDRAAASGKD